MSLFQKTCTAISHIIWRLKTKLNNVRNLKSDFWYDELSMMHFCFYFMIVKREERNIVELMCSMWDET